MIDIARKFGVSLLIAPSADSAVAGITTKTGFFGSENLDARRGSPMLIGTTVILPTASSGFTSAAAGFASTLYAWTLRSASVSVVLAGISRAATSTFVVSITGATAVCALDA